MKTQNEKIKEISENLEQGIRDFMSDPNGAYQRWLSVVAKFPRYSLNNSILICQQRPEASYVAGYHHWKSMGRYPKKGSRAIRILAPCTYKKEIEVDRMDPNTKEQIKEKKEITKQGFKVAYVFDVSDTEGKELPQIASELSGTVPQFAILMDAIRKICPAPICFDEIQGEAKGYYHPIWDRIVIQEGMSELQTLKTTLHEVTHQRLHGNKEKDTEADSALYSREQKEVEAESCAYIVMKYLGLDTSEYSFGYLSSWSKDRSLPELRTSMERIRSTSSAMITELMTEIERTASPEIHRPSLAEQLEHCKNEQGKQESGRKKDADVRHKNSMER